MSDYDETNTISLWKNNKDGNEKRPDLTGKINIEGVEYKVSLWKRNSDNPKAPVLGGEVQVAEAVGAAASSDDSDLPF